MNANIRRVPTTVGLLLVLMICFGCNWLMDEFISNCCRPSNSDFTVSSNLSSRQHVHSDITNAVLYSLAHNRIDELKPYFLEHLWHPIDKWMVEHEPVSDECSLPLDPDHRGPMGGGGRDNYRLRLRYNCPDGTYKLVVELHFVEVDGRSYIDAFDRVCETRLEVQKCWDME